MKKLSRILHAFCVHRPDINYLQVFSLAGEILMIRDSALVIKYLTCLILCFDDLVCEKESSFSISPK